MTRAMQYRADIDGLRSLAIVPIVLFHAGFSLFSGGFVGVDIFFVISGYLITSIIAKEIGGGQFDLWRFYERRIRRIFPALIVMLLVCSVAGWVLLFPLDLQAFGESLVASTGFVANISFWLKSGYFDTSSDLKPLLHTWSLAVEEQFYLFFPLVLMLANRKNRDPRLIVWIILLLSFALSLFGVSRNPDATFYLIPTRAWELLIGSVLALNAVPAIKNHTVREMLAALGLGLILVPVLVYNSQTPFPGLSALWPCLGSALIIWTGGTQLSPTRVARLLMLRPVVLIGLMSYSLYLWHWPIMVFSHHWMLDKPDLAGKLLLVLASVLVAYASFELVEKPARRHALGLSRSKIFGLAGGAALLCIGIGGLFWHNGFVSRYPAALQSLLRFHEQQTKGFIGLQATVGGQKREGLPDGGFVVGAAGQQPQIAVWGDSHVGAILNGVVGAAQPDKVPAISVFALGGCRPVADVYLAYEASTACHDHNQAVLAYLLKGPERKVVLVSRWPIALFGDVRATGKGDGLGSLALRPATSLDEAQAIEAFSLHLGRTIDALTQAGKEVVVVETIIDLPQDVPHLVFKTLLHDPATAQISKDISAYRERFLGVEQVFDRMQARHRFERIRLRDGLCEQWQCLLYRRETGQKTGQVLYTDNNHLSTSGSALLAPLFRGVLP